MRLIADIFRYIQIVMLVPFGLIGVLVLPGEIEQISTLSQWYPVYQHPGEYFQPYLQQVAAHELAVYCIVFGWALLIGLIAMQWLGVGWRILGWIVIMLHNYFILHLKDWPYQPAPTLIPEVAVALSAISLFFDFAGAISFVLWRAPELGIEREKL